MADIDKITPVGSDADETEFDFTEAVGSVTLTMEDDTEVECLILAIYPAGERYYIALLPMDDEGEPAEDADILIYRYVDHGDDEPELENIEDDEEYEIAADTFDELLDDEAFDDDDDFDEESDEE